MKQLAAKLKDFCKRSIGQLEPLEAVLPKSPIMTPPTNPIAPNIWQYISVALAFVLAVCIVVLAMQVNRKKDLDRDAASSIGTLSDEKDQLLRENQKLQNQLTEKNTGTKAQRVIVQQLQSEKEELHSRNQELQNENAMLRTQSAPDGTGSSIGTLSDEKDQLLRENQILQNQLTEQDTETEAQKAIAQQLQSEKEELRSQNQTLQNENAVLREQLGRRKMPPNRSRGNGNQLRAAPLQELKISSSPRVRSIALSKNNQGYFAFNKGEYNEAIEFFEEAKESSPTSAVIRYNLGSTYLEVKKYIKATDYLQKAVSLDREFKEAYYNLALTQHRRGYRQKARKMAQAALDIDKNYQPARQLLDAIK